MTLRKLFVLRSDVQLSELGRFIKANWQAAAEAGKPLMVEIKHFERKRSVYQNRLYFYIISVSEKARQVKGQFRDKSFWHYYYRQQCQPVKYWHEAMINGQIQLVPGSTKNMSAADFAEFVDAVFAEAGSIGIEIPPMPDDYHPDWQA